MGMVCPLRGGPENDQEACTGRVQCACGVGVCGVGEEPHAEGVLGGGARDSTGRAGPEWVPRRVE